MDVMGAISVVREHFYRADYLHLLYTRPIEAYTLHRELNYYLCAAWNRFDRQNRRLSERECIILAESWMMANKLNRAMHTDAGWEPDCALCDESKTFHRPHPENNPEGRNPPDRWLCKNGKLYVPKTYKATDWHD
jgi:hypothetical protein